MAKPLRFDGEPSPECRGKLVRRLEDLGYTMNSILKTEPDWKEVLLSSVGFHPDTLIVVRVSSRNRALPRQLQEALVKQFPKHNFHFSDTPALAGSAILPVGQSLLLMLNSVPQWTSIAIRHRAEKRRRDPREEPPHAHIFVPIDTPPSQRRNRRFCAICGLEEGDNLNIVRGS